MISAVLVFVLPLQQNHSGIQITDGFSGVACLSIHHIIRGPTGAPVRKNYPIFGGSVEEMESSAKKNLKV